ncbi:MAG: hypothetical protein AAF518_12070, partial [Spirochaetota bacterium]
MLDSDIFKNSFAALKKLSIGLLTKKLERSTFVISVLQGSGFDLLQNNFASIYAHALVEYFADSNDSDVDELAVKKLWFQYFSLSDVRGIIGKHFAEGEKEEREKLLDDNLHTGKTKTHHALKNENQQEHHLFAEYELLAKLYEEKRREVAKKDPVQHQHIELSEDILHQVREIQKELLNIEKIRDGIFRITYAGEIVEKSLQEWGQSFRELQQENAVILQAILECMEKPSELVELKQVAEKIYNFERADNVQFTAEKQDIHFQEVGEVHVHQEASKSAIKRFITHPIGIEPKDVIGREQDCQEILRLLQEGKPVHIHAIRGAGKTTLARLVVQEVLKQDKFSYFVSVDLTENFLESFLQKLMPACRIEYIQEETDEQRFDKILTTLYNLVKNSSTGKNGFLVLDNALASKSAEGKEHLSKVTSALRNNYNILVTSFQKIEHLEKYPLKNLDTEDLVTLFLKYCPNKGAKSEIVELIEFVEYHTLTIELMAKTLYESWELNSVTELLAKLKAHEWDAEELEESVFTEHSEGRIKAFPHLCFVFDASKLHKDKILLYVLKNFSFLPSEFYTGKEMSEWIATETFSKKEIGNAIHELHRMGWLEEDRQKYRYRLHSVIKEVVRFKLKPGFDDGKILVNRITQMLSIASENPKRYHYLIEQAKSISETITEINEEIVILKFRLG